MAETLETVSSKIDALGARLDAFSAAVDGRFEQADRRFEQVDQRFEQVDQRLEQVDQRFEQVDKHIDQVKEEIKGELGTKIEAVEAKVDLVLEGLGNLLKKDSANSASHARMDARLDDHDVRIAALENRST